MDFNYDNKSHFWLEPFSMIINSMFPMEIVFHEWFNYQGYSKVSYLNDDVLFIPETETIESGSRVEGFAVPELFVSDTEQSEFNFQNSVPWTSDRDSMTVANHNFERKSSGERLSMFTVEHLKEDARYVRLRLTKQWKEDKPQFKDAMFLNHAYLLPQLSDRDRLPIEGQQTDRIHGPVHNKIIDALMQSDGRDVIFSHFDEDSTKVFSYPIAWPKHAMEWLVRPRSNGWPSVELIQDIFESSCHIAPVGRGSRSDKVLERLEYIKNPELGEEGNNMERGEMDSTEWRISFTVAENKLSCSILPVPRYVMVLLKMIKKMYLPEEICTYHLKNLLFWEVESRDKSFWIEKNICKCLLRLLDRLQNCLEQQSLPHYIIPESNLFSTVGQERLIEIASVVENVRINIVSNMLSMFKRINALGFNIKAFIYSLNIDLYMQGIQDEESDAKVLYEAVLDCIIRELKVTVESKVKNYYRGLEQFGDNMDLHLRQKLSYYVYESTISRMICHSWISTNNTEVKDKDDFLAFVRKETKYIRIINDIPTIEDICQIYYESLLKDQNVSDDILTALYFMKDIWSKLYVDYIINDGSLPDITGVCEQLTPPDATVLNHIKKKICKTTMTKNSN